MGHIEDRVQEHFVHLLLGQNFGVIRTHNFSAIIFGDPIAEVEQGQYRRGESVCQENDARVLNQEIHVLFGDSMHNQLIHSCIEELKESQRVHGGRVLQHIVLILLKLDRCGQ